MEEAVRFDADCVSALQGVSARGTWGEREEYEEETGRAKSMYRKGETEKKEREKHGNWV